jgi:hypothetical protein
LYGVVLTTAATRCAAKVAGIENADNAARAMIDEQRNRLRVKLRIHYLQSSRIGLTILCASSREDPTTAEAGMTPVGALD